MQMRVLMRSSVLGQPADECMLGLATVLTVC